MNSSFHLVPLLLLFYSVALIIFYSVFLFDVFMGYSLYEQCTRNCSIHRNMACDNVWQLETRSCKIWSDFGPHMDYCYCSSQIYTRRCCTDPYHINNAQKQVDGVQLYNALCDTYSLMILMCVHSSKYTFKLMLCVVWVCHVSPIVPIHLQITKTFNEMEAVNSLQ